MNTHEYKRQILAWLTGLACSVLAAGCGSDGASETVTSETGRVLSGSASKGPLAGATIRIYDIDARGQRQGPVLAQTTTDTAGNWTLPVAGQTGYLLVESSGGLYVDEADPEPDPGQRRTIQLSAEESLSALVPADATSVAINVYTDALLRKSRHETQGADFFDVHQLNRSFFSAAFGFDITSVQPADPVAPDSAASLQQKSYAMAVGGAANAINALAIANSMPVPDYQVISAFIEDLSDCVIDGRGVAGPVQGIVTQAISLNAEILRFRNNNFEAYKGTPLLVLDQSACARSGQIADTVAPEILGLPPDFAVEAADEQGVASGVERVQRRLQTIEGFDDRDGVVTVFDDLADVLLIGDNLVTFTASDRSGNTRTVTLTITVLPPLQPTIVAPPDVIARATGELTIVNLGTPQVSDNVSGPDDLVIINDAPVQGFAPGEHYVTWTVTDEAGLGAQAVQQVNVGTVPGFEQTPVDPGPFGGLPILPDPNERPVPPVGWPAPDPGRGSGHDFTVFDADGDVLPDWVEIQLGTDPYQHDTDRDGLGDGLEIELSSDPLRASVVVHVPVSAIPMEHEFSFPRADDPKQPAFVVYAPGLHNSRVRLVAPCDDVVLLGNLSASYDAFAQATIGRPIGQALTLEGCQDVRPARLEFLPPQ